MTSIGDDLALFGFSSVLAYLHPEPAAASVSRRTVARASEPPDVRAHFTPQPRSPLAAGATAGPDPLTAAPAPRRPVRHEARAVDPPAVRIYPHLGVAYGTVDRAGLAALQSDPRVGEVSGAPQVGLIRPRAGDPAAKRRMRSWSLDALGVRDLWADGITGRGVSVAHLDTGVDTTHPALAEAVREYAEFDFSGLEVPDATPRDSDLMSGHGTHTAAIVAGRKVGRRQVGVAPGADLHCAMVIEGGDLIARILAGMDWAVAHRVRVLSLSLGLRGYRNDFVDLIAILRNHGVLPVIAVGNEGSNTSRSPGNYPNALSVGYHDVSLAVDPLSSSQTFPRRDDPLVPDLVAPGTDILSAAPGGGWNVLSGSSMAVPHVAGLAALLLEAVPDATLDDVEAAICGSAAVGGMDPDRCNRGAVNAPLALHLLRGE